jgi:hypothetical protein
LRHSYTTYVWELRPENEALKIREAYIQSHSIEVAYSLYLRKTNIINDPPPIQLPIPSVKPKAKPKKVAVVKPIPVVEPVVVRKKTREDAISNIVKGMKPAPMKAVVIQEIPISQNRRSHRKK